MKESPSRGFQTTSDLREAISQNPFQGGRSARCHATCMLIAFADDGGRIARGESSTTIDAVAESTIGQPTATGPSSRISDSGNAQVYDPKVRRQNFHQLTLTMMIVGQTKGHTMR